MTRCSIDPALEFIPQHTAELYLAGSHLQMTTTIDLLLSRQSDEDAPVPPPTHNSSPVVAFIIGLAIILLASILNAAGLNLTKLDHVS
jgi:hypothetical protein